MVLVGSACGQAPPRQAHVVAPRPPAPLKLRARDIEGHWRWTHRSDRDGVRRIEVERWHLRAPAPDAAVARGRVPVAGTLERVVSFLSLDGVPFTCNQTLSYELRTTYRLEGELSADALELREVEYDSAASPCEPGYRRLSTYRGERTGDTLVLRWPGDEQAGEASDGQAGESGGEQILVRVPPPAPPSAAAAPDAAGLAGAWRWQTRNQRRGEVRIEAEAWQLTEAPGGALRGTIERTVTVFDPRGRRYDCNGDTSYRYRDRYTLRGHRVGAKIHLTEIAVDPEAHPCLTHDQRHLDSAVGELVGAYLVLTWRGSRRQVLHRPLP